MGQNNNNINNNNDNNNNNNANKIRVRTRHAVNNLHDLRKALPVEWNTIPAHAIQRYLNSNGRRIILEDMDKMAVIPDITIIRVILQQIVQ